MKIKVEQFCSLATSPSWQAWLFHFNTDIYRKFIKKLQESGSCAKNRELMEELLGEIDDVGGADKLYEFLEEQYPHVLKHNSRHLERADRDAHGVFPGYVEGILTYPHRKIFEGARKHLEKQVKQFLSNKGTSDHIIIDEYAYVEYLERSEESLKGKIPEKNWQIAAYRKDKS